MTTLFFSFYTRSVKFYPWPEYYLGSDSSLTKLYGVWALSCRVGHKSNQTLIGYSYKFCVIISSAYFAGSTDCKSKVLWLGLFSTFTCYL